MMISQTNHLLEGEGGKKTIPDERDKYLETGYFLAKKQENIL